MQPLNRLWWLRLEYQVNRFRTLQKVERIPKITGPCLVERNLFGGRFAIDVSRSSWHKLLFVGGEGLIHERFLLRELLRPNMTVVDVGANIGYYLLLFRRFVGTRGFVACIEPSAENLVELERNIELNEFHNVSVHKVAVGMDDSVVGLRGGINGGVTEAVGGAVTVPLKRLDQLLDRKVDLLKIDVEGYEGQVLEGAMDVIQRDRPTLFLELHPHIIPKYGFSLKGIVCRLAELYGRMEAYEISPAEQQSLSRKMLIRYCAKTALARIGQLGEYVERWSTTATPHTFWVVCHGRASS